MNDGAVFLAVLFGWVAVLALLTALVAMSAPAIARALPRLLFAAAFAWTWLAVLLAEHRHRNAPGQPG